MTAIEPGRTWRTLAGPLFVTRSVGQALEFVGWVVLARRLGAGPFGVISVAFLIARYAGVFADWGALVSGARDVARDDEHRSRTRALIRRRRNLAIALGTGYVVVCFAIGEPELAPMAAVVAMLGLSRDWIATGEHKGARAATPVLVQGAVLLGVAVLVSSPDHPALAVGCAYAAAAAASVLLNPLAPAVPGGVKHVALDPWMLAAMLTTAALASLDTLILGALGTTTETGIYAAVYRLPNVWLAAVAILSGALLPIATRASGDRAESARLRTSSLRVSIGGAIVLLALTPLVYLLVPVVFGDEYRSGRSAVVVLLVATAVATAAAPLHQFYLAIGSDRRYAGFLGLSAATILVVGVALVPAFAMMGAAVATLCAHLVLAGCLLVATWRTRTHH